VSALNGGTFCWQLSSCAPYSSSYVFCAAVVARAAQLYAAAAAASRSVSAVAAMMTTSACFSFLLIPCNKNEISQQRTKPTMT